MKRLNCFLLVLLLALSSAYSLPEESPTSLSPEEKAALPDLPKESLIEIILNYDESLTQIENYLIVRRSDLELRERNLTAKEKNLEAREFDLISSRAHLEIRERLLAESYELQKKAVNRSMWEGIGYGFITGIIVGGVTLAAAGGG